MLRPCCAISFPIGCRKCRYSYKDPTGDQACPITTLYWDFLDRHYDMLKSNARMGFQIRNLAKKKAQSDIKAFRAQAKTLRNRWYG